MTATLRWHDVWTPVRAIALGLLVVELISVLALLSRPWLTGWLIDRTLHGGAMAWPATGLLATWLLRAGLGDLRERLLAACGTEIGAGLRGRLLGRLLSTRGHTPDRLADGERFASQAPRLALEAWSALLRMSIGAGMLALIHPDLLVAILPAAALCVVIGWSGRLASMRAAAHTAEARAAERSRWSEIIAARGAWTPPGWLAWMTADTGRRADLSAACEVQAARTAGWWQPAMAGAVAGGVVLVLLAGSGQVARSELSPGGLAAGIFLVFLAIGPLLELAAGAERWAGTAAAWSRLRAGSALHDPPTGPGLAWSALSVAWPGGGRLELPAGAVPPGGRLLLSGRSGAGKSTLLRLLAGRCAPASGSMTPGGRSILLTHDGALPPWTVGELLRSAGGVDAAGARDAAVRLGLEAVIGDFSARADALRGTAAGQAVALTAAYLAQAPVLLLDEALAAIDPAVAARVVTRLATDRTVVLATHRRRGVADWPVLEL